MDDTEMASDMSSDELTMDPVVEKIPAVLTNYPEGKFSTLVAAVTAAKLVDALNGAGPFTVFAPTDDAFAAFLKKAGQVPPDTPWFIPFTKRSLWIQFHEAREGNPSNWLVFDTWPSILTRVRHPKTRVHHPMTHCRHTMFTHGLSR